MAESTETSLQDLETRFPCSLAIRIPFPTARLASTALQVLEVDQELSPLVHRAFALASTEALPTETANAATTHGAQDKTVLLTYYRATTNRMLRVSVNGFFESLGTVIACMRELDKDVVGNEWIGDGLEDVDQLVRVEGLEEKGILRG